MKIKQIVSILLLILVFVSCDNEQPVINTPVNRTVLIYFAGDNSLSSFVNDNLRMIKAGIKADGLEDGNLLVYMDNSQKTPSLFQLKLEADTIRQINIETYDRNQNSASTETLSQVINTAMTYYPADSYGLVLWSHGTAWLPSDVFSYLRSFGQDGNDFMEINDLASALSKYHFDFLLFDACYMASTEVAYALRGCTDYIIASPTEVLAYGFPYQNFIGSMFKKEADVVDIATQFYNYYKTSAGTVSVTKTAALDKLAASCRDIFHDKTESDLFSVPVSDLQIMEYLTPTYHSLYDFDDYVSRLATEEQYTDFQKNLNEAIIYKATTPKSVYAYSGGTYLKINKFSGLSIYVPQETLSKLTDWYKDLEWYKNVYQ